MHFAPSYEINHRNGFLIDFVMGLEEDNRKHAQRFPLKI